jgi:hypothetical protein
MSRLSLDPAIFLFLSLGILLLILVVIITLTIRTSIRLGKAEPKKWRLLFAVAFLQLLPGGVTVLIGRTIRGDANVVLGIAAGVTLLSGLFLLKWILKYGWKQSLRLWAVAAVMQGILLPVCSALLAVVWTMVSLQLYPPQY